MDTGSPVSFLNKKTAEILLRQLPEAKFRDVKRYQLGVTYVDYNKKTDQAVWFVRIPDSVIRVEERQSAFLVSENRTRKLLGLNLHEQLGIKTIQRKSAEVNSTEDLEEMEPTSKFWRDYSVNSYLNVFSRLGRSKNH